MTDDVLVIWEQNFRVPLLHARLTYKTCTHYKHNLVYTNFPCPRGVLTTSIYYSSMTSMGATNAAGVCDQSMHSRTLAILSDVETVSFERKLPLGLP